MWPVEVLLFAAILLISCRFAENASVFDSVYEQGTEEYNRDKAKTVELPPNKAIFDYIVVGGGSAGCVLASRLSENPNSNVILIEAGGNENIIHDMPLLAPSLQKSEFDWQYQTTPQKYACFGMRDERCSMPRGKVLGGGSSINFMFYTRGNKNDYDRWGAEGNYGWSYADVFHYFLRSEMSTLRGLEQSPWHNRTGEQDVEFVQYRSEIANSFVTGAQEAGHKYIDYNGYSQLGVSFAQVNTRKGHRASTSKSFIKPIQDKRRNLRVLTFSRVIKIHIDPRTLTAYGVNYVYRDKVYTVRSRREVILSAGVVNSPQLLMLSGIGPATSLQPVGIPQLLELPVGQVLYDHMTHFGPVFTTNTTGSTLFQNSITQKDLYQYRAGDDSTRISSTAAMESLIFIKTPNSRKPANVPDVEIIMGAVGLASDGGKGLKETANFRDDIYIKAFKELENREHFTTINMHLHPKSRGSLWLKDRNPFTAPEINPNYLKEPEDVEFILEGIKESIRITKMPAMQKINATLWERNVPGCEGLKFGTDDYWRCSIRVLSFNMYHGIGTCKMGPDSDSLAVVNSQLKVRGVRRLRIADVSVMPIIPAGHTNAAAVMIGEKASDLIKQEWEESPYFY